ncbi:MAG: ABC transporter permease [Tissierellia bacterium]|nr:ABC transporter permease [Tissierellia bacterium]
MDRFTKRFLLTLAFLFLYAPIIVLIVFSFNDSKLRGTWSGFTFKWYIELFTDRNILTSFYHTIFIAVVATVVATIIGTITAIGIHDLRGWKKSGYLNINYLPVLNPDIVTAIALMSLYGFLHLQLGLFTLTLSHIIFCIPYVILSVLPKLKQMDKNLIEAALDLGCTPRSAITKVVIPQIIPGIASGALMSFTLSLDDFVISFFTTGMGVSNLSITLYSMTKKGINPSINALSALLFVTVLLLLVIINSKTNVLEES